jgi:uncharacterized protein (DUF3084 family)
MTSGYILIGAMLLLGGVIAVSGDRIGTRVGKAKLTLFKLRPKHTATLLTIVSGTLISGSTLTLLFAANEQLRTGIFDLQAIQQNLSKTKGQLQEAVANNNYFKQELAARQAEQSKAQEFMEGLDKTLQDEIFKQSNTAKEVANIRKQLEQVVGERTKLEQEIAQIKRDRQDLLTQQPIIKQQIIDIRQRIVIVSNDIKNNSTSLDSLQNRSLTTSQIRNKDLTGQVKNNVLEFDKKKLIQKLEPLKTELDYLNQQLEDREIKLTNIQNNIKEYNQQLELKNARLAQKKQQQSTLESELNRKIEQQKVKDKQLSKLRDQLNERKQRLAFLKDELTNLEQQYKQFRQGNIAISRYQVLSAGLVRIKNPELAEETINQILSQANRAAIAATRPDNINTQVKIVKIRNEQVDQLIERIKDGQEYVIRIYAAGNYRLNEQEVEVFVDASLNEKVFNKGDLVGAISFDPTQISDEQIRQQLNLLLSAVQFRVQRSGIIGDVQLGDDNIISRLAFLKRVQQLQEPVELQAIVTNDTNLIGPLRIKLQAIANGKLLFST